MFANAGARHRDIVICPGAGSDQWRVADAAFEFAERPARGGRGGKATRRVESDRADGPVSDIANIVAGYAYRQCV